MLTIHMMTAHEARQDSESGRQQTPWGTVWSYLNGVGQG